MPATITGTLYDIQGNALKYETVTITPLSAPVVNGATVHLSDPINLVTDDSGVLPTLNLVPGEYTLEAKGDSFNFEVSETSGTYDISTLVSSSLTYISPVSQGVFQVADTDALLALAASDNNVRAYITSPDPGAAREVYWDKNSTATHNGTTIFKPTSLDADEAGRWLEW